MEEKEEAKEVDAGVGGDEDREEVREVRGRGKNVGEGTEEEQATHGDRKLGSRTEKSEFI